MPATDMTANGEAQKCADAPAQEVETNEPADLATWWNRIVKSVGGEGLVLECGRASRQQRDRDDLGGCLRRVWQIQGQVLLALLVQQRSWTS